MGYFPGRERTGRLPDSPDPERLDAHRGVRAVGFLEAGAGSGPVCQRVGAFCLLRGPEKLKNGEAGQEASQKDNGRGQVPEGPDRRSSLSPGLPGTGSRETGSGRL